MNAVSSERYAEFLTSDGKLMIPPGLIIPNPTQPREEFDESDLDRLAKNIKEFGTEKPIILMPLDPPRDGALFMIVDGEYRWRACKKANCLVWAVVGPVIEDPEDLFEKSLNANYPQAPHTTIEIIHAIRRLEKRGRTMEQIALRFGKSVAWVNTHKRVSTLHPKVIDMLRTTRPESERLPLMHASDLADLPQSEQTGLAEMAVVAGLSRAHLKNLIKTAQLGRSTPNHRRTRPDKEFEGIMGLFARTHDRVSLLVKNEGEVARVVKGRGPEKVRELLGLMERSRSDIVKLIQAFSTHA
ncbi:MAG: ParB/RepB/Spo0J family partition protein [Candidatus Taylorbacteria bacterium]|nr:ParB/RepB/Spo0J family partition protein [Candidatus Taylorbacteria bacterium]